MRKAIVWLGLGLIMASTGCATTAGSKVSQADVDSLNSRISALQAQLSERDAEIAKLQNRMRDEESARAQAETEKRALSRQLDSALSDLRTAKTSTAPAKRAASDSDLK